MDKPKLDVGEAFAVLHAFQWMAYPTRSQRRALAAARALINETAAVVVQRYSGVDVSDG